ncbi:MAG: endonuclease III [bacterium]
MRDIILNFLEELFPDAHCELNFNNDYELLINIALSAQTTDKKVNQVTEDLFLIYPNIETLRKANPIEVEQILKPLGLAKVKANSIIKCANQIYDNFNGVIPQVHKDLISLQGVGNKTANVFLAVFCNIPTFPVDTHVKRVANRLCLSKSDDVIQIEKDLMNYFDKNTWIKLHHQLIFFGRYFCTSKNPNCNKCLLNKICSYKI